MTIGESIKLAATIFPGDAPDQTITWENSNPDVATVTDGL